ncbi:MAG: methyl-accepting chemotaxis protein [Methylococcaceae bacterium]|nr:methyl-accepting chemotaxis protein [Methylococcaceae bacterium]
MPLRTRITLSVFIAILSVITVFVIYNSFVTRQLEDKNSLQTIHDDKQIWTLIVNNQLSKMRSQVQLFTRDRSFKKALLKYNEEKLAEQSKTSFNALSSLGLSSNLLITNTAGKILAEQPKKNTNTANSLVSEAVTSGKITSRLTNWEGEAVLSVVFPILKRGKIIGLAVLNNTLDALLDELNQNIRGESFFISLRQKQNPTSFSSIFSSFDLQLPEPGKSINTIEPEKDSYFSVNAISISNKSEDVGVLVTKKDVTMEVTQANKYLFFGITVCFLLVLTILTTIFFQIKKALCPLSKIIPVVKSISHGDFTVGFEQKFDGDMGELQDAIVKMKEELGILLEHISESVAELMGAAQIAEVLEASLAGTKTQQEKVKSLIQSISGIGSSVENVANVAHIAAEKAQESNAEASKGSEIVTQTTGSIESLATDVSNSSFAIRNIEMDSTNIGEVIKLIKNISEQTNLLALNAAIEAARAGDQGRGFAVVADEVRTLAQRTQSSAQEIELMVKSLQENTLNAVGVMDQCLDQTKVCVTEAEHTGIAFNNIIESVKSLVDLNDQIVNATVEQVTLNSEISNQSTEIRHVAEQMESSQRSGSLPSSDRLVNISCELQLLMSKFKLKTTSTIESPNSDDADQAVSDKNKNQEDDILF